LALPGLEVFTDYAFMRTALFAGLLVAALCGVLGVFLVLRGQSMIGDGLSHVAFSGVALGLTLGVYPLGMALVFSALGALVIYFMQERGWARSDAAIGIIFTAGLAAGVVIVSLGGGFNVDVTNYLFGTILAVSTTDLYVVAGLVAVLSLLVALFYKEFFYVAFNEEAARVSGVPVRALNVLFTLLTACAIVVAVRVVGILLVSALLVVPASASLRLVRSFGQALLLSALLGALAVVVGLYASFVYDVATGGAIALTSLGLFALSVVLQAVLPVRRRAQ